MQAEEAILFLSLLKFSVESVFSSPPSITNNFSKEKYIKRRINNRKILDWLGMLQIQASVALSNKTSIYLAVKL